MEDGKALDLQASQVQPVKRHNGSQAITLYTCKKCGKERHLAGFFDQGCAAAPANGPSGGVFRRMVAGKPVAKEDLEWRAPHVGNDTTLQQLRLSAGDRQACFLKAKGHILKKVVEQDGKLRAALREGHADILATLCDPDFDCAKYQEDSERGGQRIIYTCKKCGREGILFFGRTFKYVEDYLYRKSCGVQVEEREVTKASYQRKSSKKYGTNRYMTIRAKHCEVATVRNRCDGGRAQEARETRRRTA